MIKYSIFFIAIIFHDCVSAQKIVDLNADAFVQKRDRVSFIKKTKKGFEVLDYNINDEDSKSVLIEQEKETYIDFNKLLEKERIEKKNIAATNTLRVNTPNKLLNDLLNIQFSSNEKENIKTHLNLISKYFFSKTVYTPDIYENKNEYRLSNTSLYSYIIFRINQKYCIIILFNKTADGGIIIPYKLKYDILLDHEQYDSSAYNIFSTKLREALFEEQSNQEQMFQIFELKNKYGLKDIFNEVVLPPIYDTIIITDNNFIYARKKNTYTIFNSLLEKINLPNIRAAYSQRYFTGSQILQNNQLYWISKSGEKSDTFIRKPIGVCGTVPYGYSKLVRKGREYKLIIGSGDFGNKEDQLDTIFLSGTIEYDSIKFLNNKEELNYNANTGITATYRIPYDCFLVKNDNSQYGLVQIVTEKNKIKEQKLLLPVIYDSVQVYGYYHPVLFSKNKLYGYWPQNKEPKYKSIDKFNYFFARFELPNGKKGWLDLNGNEYIDK